MREDRERVEFYFVFGPRSYPFMFPFLFTYPLASILSTKPLATSGAFLGKLDRGFYVAFCAERSIILRSGREPRHD